MADYGTGIDVVFDWPLRFTYASGTRNLGNNLARRLQTVRGSLPWDPNCGYDVRSLLRSDLTAAEASAAEAAIASECEKDPRVDSASCALTFVPAASSLTITLSITPVDGIAFAFVLSVDALTVSILRLGNEP